MLDWNVAVYCSSEADRLAGCLKGVAAALAGHNALITVIVNGSRDNSADVAVGLAKGGLPIEVFRISKGDKSNAINHFFHALRSPAAAYAGVDGYVFVARDAFSAMQERLRTDAHALAVTGVATTGRTMTLATDETLKIGGRLHGQLHAFRPAFLDRMVAKSIRLPIGLYRGDGLLGSMTAHDLDPLTNPWDNARIAGVGAATYEGPVLSPLRFQDVKRQLRRKVRQMRGSLENAAIKSIIYRTGYEGLPTYADDMIKDYLAGTALPPVSMLDGWFRRLAIRDSLSSGPIDERELRPQRLG